VKHYPTISSYFSGLYAKSDLDWFLDNYSEQQTALPGQPSNALPIALPETSVKEADLSSLQITLGVAWYRHDAYHDAIVCLEKFTDEASGSDSYGWFHLAMAHQQSGNHDEAQRRYKQAVRWMEENKPDNTELLKLRTEAADVLGWSESETALFQIKVN
jgi:tetratricopeptide (TPR) repeat protein